jgi:hypothetical protein
VIDNALDNLHEGLDGLRYVMLFRMRAQCRCAHVESTNCLCYRQALIADDEGRRTAIPDPDHEADVLNGLTFQAAGVQAGRTIAEAEGETYEDDEICDEEMDEMSDAETEDEDDKLEDDEDKLEDDEDKLEEEKKQEELRVQAATAIPALTTPAPTTPNSLEGDAANASLTDNVSAMGLQDQSTPASNATYGGTETSCI